jgi:hypothetical protein
MAYRVDVFVMLDDVISSKSTGWVNRNRIRSNCERGWSWITVPIQRNTTSLEISEVCISENTRWKQKVLASLTQTYGKAPRFPDYFPSIKEMLESSEYKIADLNIRLIQQILRWLAINTELVRSSELGVEGSKEEKLVALCQRLDAKIYVANNGSQPYIEKNKFTDEGVGFVFQDYEHPTYNQGARQFLSHMSVLDLLFSYGEEAREVILTGQPASWEDSVLWK